MNDIYLWISTVGAVGMAIFAMMIRVKATKQPATVRKIILPPIFMSTGFLMFLYEPTRPEMLQVIEAILIGMVFSVLLIKTSKFEIKDHEIYMKRSRVFAFILIGLLISRILLKLVIGSMVHIEEVAGMFFILAYAMIVPWRISMYMKFKKVEKHLQSKSYVPIDL